MKTQEMKINLWFNNKAEEAVQFYTSVFKRSQINYTSYYNKEGHDIHGQPQGKVMAVDFTLNNMNFIALNGGPEFQFNEAISIVVLCETQKEIDYYWEKLTAEGSEGPCGWLKDKFGISWQITPKILSQLLAESSQEKAERVTAAFMKMKKLDIDELIHA